MSAEAQTEAGWAEINKERNAIAKCKGLGHTPLVELHNIAETLRESFRGGKTKELAWRKVQLQAVIALIQENTEAIAEAVAEDLGGPKLRATFEMDAVAEARYAIKMLSSWASDESIPDANAFGKSVVRREPKGVVLIISPWNFPIALCLRPLVSVLAAGNCAVLKPSEMAVHSSALLAKLVPKYLPTDAVRIVTGAVLETSALLEQRWDHIMYTGNGTVGRIVMAAAAKHLT